MKARLIASLVVAMMLVAVVAVPAMAVSDTVPASVTVSEYISFTVTDYDSDTVGGPGGDGLTFGSLDPGTEDNPEGAQTLATPTAAVNVRVAAETNVDCNIEVKGTDFTGAGTIAINNAKWDLDSVVTGATAMSTMYANIMTSTAGVLEEEDVWHWLSIPSGQAAGSYSSTFTYQAIKTP